MKSSVFYLLLTIVLGFGLEAPLAHSTQVANFWRCSAREGGAWQFGRGIWVCASSDWGSDQHVNDLYSAVVFHENATRAPETARYMQEMVALIRDAATIYYHERNPAATATEVQAWQRAVLAVAHQESYFTHYRLTGGVLKFMRGDSGHGHGMMQLDDRSHYVPITQGKGWELAHHLFYAMEEYYSDWVRAPAFNCVKTASDFWQARARSAYSTYNGGASAANFCRWTNSRSVWARNDVGFDQKYVGQSWLKVVNNVNAPSPVDIGCALAGGEHCPPKP